MSFYRTLLIRLRQLLLVGLSLFITACQGTTMIEPVENYFDGKQLELARLVDAAEPKAVYDFAMSMTLEELNHVGKKKTTVLTYTMIKAGNEDKWYPIITALIKAGANPVMSNTADTGSYMEVALGEAELSKNLKFLKAALDAGINPDTDANDYPEEPIMFQFSRQGGLAGIKLLTSYGANVNRADIFGVTPVQQALTTLALDEVIFLLDQNANPKVVDYHGESFASLLAKHIQNMSTNNDPRLPRLIEIKNRIIKMGVKWPPESPEQLRARVKAEKKKQGIDFKFMPEEGYEAFVPKYVPAPVWKTPPRPGMQ